MRVLVNFANPRQGSVIMGMTFFHSPKELATLQHLDLSLIRLFYGDNPGHWKSRYPYSRLVFILASDGASGLGGSGKRIAAQPGDWFWLPPFLEVEHEQNRTMFHLSVHFRLELRAGIELPRRERRILHGNDVSLPGRIAELRKAPDELSLAAGVKMLCWQIVAPILSDPKRRPSLPSALELARYSVLWEYWSEHLATGMTVAEMARLVGMGKESFVKHFRADTGCSPKNYFHRLQAGRAGQLLLGTKLSVREVAERLGFCNEFYFSRFFKKHTGVSPAQFRRM